MKKIRYILLVLMLICTSIIPVHGLYSYVDDNNFFNYYLNQSLESMSKNFYKQYGINVAVISIKFDDEEFDLANYATSHYQNVFGDSNGIIFAFNQNSRYEIEKYIGTFGNVGQYFDSSIDVNAVFTDNDPKHIAYIIQAVVHQIALTINNVEPSRYVVDLANLLSLEQITSLEQKINHIINEYQMDVVILTTYLNNGKEVQDFADDYFDENNYGIGTDKDGLLLVLSFQHNDWYISTSGKAIDMFTDWGIDYLGKVMIPNFSDEEYYNGFNDFLDYTDKFIDQALTEKPYDRYSQGDLPSLYDDYVSYNTDNTDYENEEGRFSSNEKIIYSLIGGLIIGFIVSMIRLGNLKTKKAVYNANAYVKENSLNLTKSDDLFLYHTIRKTRKPEPSDDYVSSKAGGKSSLSSGSKSTGSSTHRSSSGRTHGGGGGKF